MVLKFQTVLFVKGNLQNYLSNLFTAFFNDNVYCGERFMYNFNSVS